MTSAFVLFYSAPRSAERKIRTWAMSCARLPVDAVLLIFAAVGIRNIAGRFRQAQGSRAPG